jgi:uncharacterized membrane protein YjdF
MGRAIITIAFILVLLKWLEYEFKLNASLRRHWKWIGAALLLQALSGIVFYFANGKNGNFVYHAVGGGVMSALVFEYLLLTYRIHFNWRIQVVLLYCFVSALGVLNELAEYVAEFFIGLGTLSWDSHDTWRDLTANTLGALVAWFFIKLLYKNKPTP